VRLSEVEHRGKSVRRVGERTPVHCRERVRTCTCDRGPEPSNDVFSLAFSTSRTRNRVYLTCTEESHTKTTTLRISWEQKNSSHAKGTEVHPTHTASTHERKSRTRSLCDDRFMSLGLRGNVRRNTCTMKAREEEERERADRDESGFISCAPHAQIQNETGVQTEAVARTRISPPIPLSTAEKTHHMLRWFLWAWVLLSQRWLERKRRRRTMRLGQVHPCAACMKAQTFGSSCRTRVRVLHS
jgi:hypothetical protein